MQDAHLIIGSGVIGKATGTWLEANNEIVTYNDTNANLLNQLKKEGKNVTANINYLNYDYYWICTAEWNVENVCKTLKKYILMSQKIIIRSTTFPGQIDTLAHKYTIKNIAHVPEFLRAATAIDDIFHPDRIIIGTRNEFMKNVLTTLFNICHPGIPIFTTTPITSELIKLTSNAWLSSQITFWNEIKKLCKKYDVNPQSISNGCTLDKRISNYGAKMIGDKISGFCLPKDIIAINKAFEKADIVSEFFKMVVEINEATKS